MSPFSPRQNSFKEAALLNISFINEPFGTTLGLSAENRYPNSAQAGLRVGLCMMRCPVCRGGPGRSFVLIEIRVNPLIRCKG